jgi:hypothetical protein
VWVGWRTASTNGMVSRRIKLSGAMPRSMMGLPGPLPAGGEKEGGVQMDGTIGMFGQE